MCISINKLKEVNFKTEMVLAKTYANNAYTLAKLNKIMTSKYLIVSIK